ncbi:hypothetical protein [Haloarcula halophila]|uniref:hypothetical protein n=1 Tax=Haloarcula TaxID=2237 RepID=UPI0023E44A58|nr:hypothetical protein [Halomicroarcula sp. DFY41]
MEPNGLVAEVIDNYNIVVNIGSDDGVEPDHRYGVYTESDPIEDPETGEKLGRIEYKIIKVKPVDIHPDYAIMTTDETTGGFTFTSQLQQKPKKLAKDPEFEPGRDYVQQGDTVKYITTVEDDDS